jgi:regulator of RNase E activity RraA
VDSDPDIAAHLAALGASDAADELGGARVVTGLTAVVPGVVGAGRALPVSGQPGDNLALRRALDVARPGDVIVLGLPDHTSTCAYFGSTLAAMAQDRGVAGVLVAGAVRDVRELRRLGFPTFALGTHPLRPTAVGEGGPCAEVVVQGVPIGRDDWIVADDDGVVVLTLGDRPS